MKRSRLSKTNKEDIRLTLARCKPGKQTKAVALDLAKKYGLSVARIYAISREHRANGRKKRSDANIKKKELDNKQSRFLLKLFETGYSTAKALEIAQVNEIIKPGSISAGYIDRYRKEKGFTKKMLAMDLTPHRSFEAAYPNKMQQVDTTIALAFYINKDGSIGYEGPTKRYKNKPGNRLPRISLFLLVDDHSRAKYAEFFIAESSINALLFLERAWRKKENQQRFPFYGLPKILYCDKGSINQSAKFKQAMEALNIILIPHRTEGCTATGKVERGIQTIQKDFELATKLMRFESMEHLNEELYDWLIGHNNKICSSTGEAPFNRWTKIHGEQLREVPEEELMRVLHYDKAFRQVKSNLSFSINNIEFKLPWKEPFFNWKYRNIEVYWYPGDMSTVFVATEQEQYEIHAKATEGEQNESLRFVLPPETERDKLMKELETVDMNGVRLTGYGDELYGKDFMPRKAEGETPEIKPLMAEVGLDYWEATAVLIDNNIFHKPMLTEEKQWLKNLYQGRERISESEIMDIFSQWMQTQIHEVKQA